MSCEFNNKIEKLSLRNNDSQSTDSFEEFTIKDFECFKNMLAFFETELLCDVALLAGDKEKVKSHRVVLSSASDYFRAMFCGSLKEAEANEVIFDEVDGKTLKTIIASIYSGSLKLHNDNVENVVKAAHLFLLKPIENVCCEFLKKHIDTCNAVGLIKLAERYDYADLFEYSVSYVCKNFMEIRHNTEFLCLEIDLLERIMSDDNLRVPSEEEVFNALASWISFDEGKRSVYLERLLKCVRMALLPLTFIINVMEKICLSKECIELLYRTCKWKMLPDNMRQSLLPDEQIRLRSLSLKDVTILISGWENPDGMLCAGLLYNSSSEYVYREWPSHSGMRTGFGSTTLDEKLVIAGGFSQGEVTDRVDCFDFKTFEWTELPSMLRSSEYVHMTAIDGQIYALSFDGYSHYLDIFDLTINTWVEKSKFSSNRFVNFIIGMFTNSSVCTAEITCENNFRKNISVFEQPYTTFKNTLFERNTLLDLRAIGMVSKDGVDIFVAVYSNRIVRHNTKTGKIMSTINIPYTATDCTVIGNRFIIHGGTTAFQEYDPFENSFQPLPIFKNLTGNAVIVGASEV